MGQLGDTIREIRLRRGLSQTRLARRAGTRQATISRIERGLESPSFERFEQLLLVMGERPVLATAPLPCEVPDDALRRGTALSPSDRLAESASWNHVVTELEVTAARMSELR